MREVCLILARLVLANVVGRIKEVEDALDQVAKALLSKEQERASARFNNLNDEIRKLRDETLQLRDEKNKLFDILLLERSEALRGKPCSFPSSHLFVCLFSRFISMSCYLNRAKRPW